MDGSLLIIGRRLLTEAFGTAEILRTLDDNRGGDRRMPLARLGRRGRLLT